MDKKWLIGIFTSVFLVAGLVGFRDQLGRVWAAPEKVSKLEKDVKEEAEVQNDLEKLVYEQHTRLEKQEAVYQAQMQSVEKQLELIAEIKKRK